MGESRRHRILIAEDDPDVQKIYEGLFASLPRLELRVTTDGMQASALLRDEPFDVAILDVKLPSMNGLQVASTARNHKTNQATPLFLVTGFVDQQTRERVAGLERATLIVKPFDRAALQAQVLQVLKPEARAAFDVRVVNAVLAATAEVMTHFAGQTAKVAKPSLRQNAAPTRKGLAGLIGIGGETFSGSLAIVAGRELATVFYKHTMGQEGAPPDSAMLGDLMGELANQVCGRIKRRFGELGIGASIGLPEVVMGDSFQLVHRVTGPVLVVPLTVATHMCEVEFCMIAQASFQPDAAKGKEKETDKDKRTPDVDGVLIFE